MVRYSVEKVQIMSLTVHQRFLVGKIVVKCVHYNDNAINKFKTITYKCTKFNGMTEI